MIKSDINNLIRKLSNFLGVLCLFLGVNQLAGQDSLQRNIETQRILVTKAYQAKLLEVEKINSEIQLSDSLFGSKPDLRYELRDFPIVSGYKPAKPLATGLLDEPTEVLSNSFIGFGYGTQEQLYADASLYFKVSHKSDLGIDFYYDGYGLNVPNTLINSTTYFVRGSLLYKRHLESMDAGVKMTFKSSQHGYYGLIPSDRHLLDSITQDVGVNRHTFRFRTDLNWHSTNFRNLTVEAKLHEANGDIYELGAAIGSHFKFPLVGNTIDLKINSEVSNGSTLIYSNGEIGYSQVDRDLRLKIGLRANNLFSPEGYQIEVDNNSFVFPLIELSYQSNSSVLIPYLNVDSGFELFRFEFVSDQNPYLNSNFDNLFHFDHPKSFKKGQLGLRSADYSEWTFDLWASYQRIENFSFFFKKPRKIQNQSFAKRSPGPGYFNYVSVVNATAFDLGFTDLNAFRIGIDSQLNIGLGRFKLGVEYVSFHDLSENTVLWNVPNISSTLSGFIKMSSWATLSFENSLIGERPFKEMPVIVNALRKENVAFQQGTLGVYFSGKAHLTFHLTKNLDLFSKISYNSSGDAHGRWGYYPEHSILLLGGLNLVFPTRL